MGEASEFLELMKRAAVDAVEQTKPLIYTQGRVTNISPIEVRINQQMPLTKDNLIQLVEHVGTYETGDKVALLRVNGGQKYLILGRVV